MLKSIKLFAKRVPGVKHTYEYLHRIFRLIFLKMRSTEATFTEFYKKNGWGGKHSISGTGSEHIQTKIIQKSLPVLLKEFKISTMLDIPCGDFFWMNTVNLNNVHYVGADIVEPLVQRNQNFYQTKSIVFKHLNLLKDDLPMVDLILCRDCLVHFSFRDIYRALKNICNSGSKFLLTTTFTHRRANKDIPTGQWRVLNLEIDPFNFPKPIHYIVENCTENNGSYKDKSLGLWDIVEIKNCLK